MTKLLSSFTSPLVNEPVAFDELSKPLNRLASLVVNEPVVPELDALSTLLSRFARAADSVAEPLVPVVAELSTLSKLARAVDSL